MKPAKRTEKVNRKGGRPPLTSGGMRSFTCYLPEVDLKRAEKIAKKNLSNQSAVVRQAIHLGLKELEKS